MLIQPPRSHITLRSERHTLVLLSVPLLAAPSNTHFDSPSFIFLICHGCLDFFFLKGAGATSINYDLTEEKRVSSEGCEGGQMKCILKVTYTAECVHRNELGGGEGR